MDIGFDFGTTNCSIGWTKPDGSEVVRGPWPSEIVWHNGEFFFGRAARELRDGTDQEVRVIRDVKLLLHGDSAATNNRPFSATEAAAALMRHVIDAAVTEDIDQAVIATPVRVAREQRIRTKRAAERAGAKSIRYVYEPTAALIGSDDARTLPPEANVLVIDWGGGTLDIAVIRCEQGRFFEERTVEGDVHGLGGSAIDEELTRRVLDRHPRAARFIGDHPWLRDRLKQVVEELKIDALSSEGESSGEIAPAWLPYVISIDPSLVLATMRDFAERALRRIVDILARAGLGQEDISHLLFAGGVCQSSLVSNVITEGFPGATVIENLSPQMTTARGCIRLTRRQFSLELAADFAALQCDNSHCVLLRKGLSLAEGRYVQFDFWLADPYAANAVFDLGVVHDHGWQRELPAEDLSKYQSLCTITLPLGRSADQAFRAAQRSGSRTPSPDILKLCVGLDPALSVRALLVSEQTGSETEAFVVGVPLAVRMSEFSRNT